MANEQRFGNVKQKLAKHGEKIGLGAAAALLVGYLLTGLLFSSQDPNVSLVKNLAKKVRDEKAASEPRPNEELEKIPTFIAKVQSEWNTVQEAAAGDPWSASWITLHRPIPAPTSDGKPLVKEKLLQPVTLKLKDVTIDGIVLEWTVEPLTSTTHEVVGPDQFVLERKTSGGSWEVLADIANAATREYRDAKTTPKTNYAYRLKALNSKHKLAVNAPKEVSARTLGIFDVRFSNVTPREDKMLVWVQIDKYDPQYGKVSTKHFHAAGDVIGRWPESDGAEATGKHPFQLPGTGRQVTIDFDTKFTILAIQKDRKFTVKFKVHKDTRNAETGAVTGCEISDDSRDLRSDVVIYKDDEGRELTWYSRKPEIEDQVRCTEHGDAQAPPDAPPADGAEKKILEQAEKFFAEKKWRDALSKYEELQKRYSNTELYKSKRVYIENRIKACQANLKK